MSYYRLVKLKTGHSEFEAVTLLHIRAQVSEAMRTFKIFIMQDNDSSSN